MTQPTRNPSEAPLANEEFSAKYEATVARRERYAVIAFVIAVTSLSANFLVPLMVLAFIPGAMGRIDGIYYSISVATLVMGVLCCGFGTMLGQVRVRVACLTLLVPYTILLQQAIGALARR
jgi:membrane-bound acyltransferase YfiQ involved in biofilm formation